MLPDRPRPRPPIPVRVAVVTAALGLLLSGCSASAAGGGSPSTATSGSGTTPVTSPTPSTSSTPSTSPAVTGTPSAASGSQAAVLAALPGPVAGTCADTTQRNVRSGSLGAGDFVEARKVYKNGGTGSAPATVTLHIIPENPGALAGVSMTMTRQRNPVIVHTYTSTTHESAGGVSYYVLTFPVNEPGPWQLVVTAGADKGCFTTAFNRPT